MKPTLTTLQQELENVETTELRRLQIGKRLESMGDSRPGVGVKDSFPDIVWLPVTPGGEIKITRHWRPDTPEDEEKIINIGSFSVKPFYISKYPVTHAQYQTFVEAEDGFDNGSWWQRMPERYQRQKLGEQHTKSFNNPRDNISWYQSVAFARWMSNRLDGLELPHPTGKGTIKIGKSATIRLPTEWEWQWAAQNGAEVRHYPWGDAAMGYANTAESGLKQATAVGMYPQGAAACDALDMAGNLMEWCANDKVKLKIIDAKSTAEKALRGGDWGYDLENALCAYCDNEEPHSIDALNGFRLILG